MSETSEKAKKSAVNILEYADNTERRLREKLGRKGFSPDDIETAVAYVKAGGLLNDKRYIAAAAEYMANVKLYGKARIAQSLYAKGFSRDDISALEYEDIDFCDVCRRRILKTKNAEGEKLVAALRRYGFCYSEIRAALDLIKNDG